MSLSSFKRFAAAAFMPLPVFVLLVLLATLLRLFKHDAWARWVAAVAVTGLLLVSWQPVAEALLRPLEQRHALTVDAAELADIEAIVVLGAGWQPRQYRPITADLSSASAVRIMEGVRLAHAHPQAQLIVSGGSRYNHAVPVSSAFREMAELFGVEPTRIVEMTTPLNTAEEARAALNHLQAETRFLLVTSAWHMPRAMAHFRHVGLDPLPAATDHLSGTGNRARAWRSWPSATQLLKTERALHEYMGLLALPLDHREP